MESILVQIERLPKILLLHFVPDSTLLAMIAGFGKEELVDDDVVSIDLVLGEFLDEPLGFV